MTKLSMTIKDVCAVTGIGRTKIYEAINTGALKARKLDKRTLVLQDDLAAYLAGLEVYEPKAAQV